MSYNSPHHITMHFDLTEEEGRDAFAYARLGEASHTTLWKLWDEMHRASSDLDGKPDQITHQWLQRLLEIMDDYGVPLDV